MSTEWKYFLSGENESENENAIALNSWGRCCAHVYLRKCLRFIHKFNSCFNNNGIESFFSHSLTLLNIEKFENIYILLPVDDIKTAVQTRKFYRIFLMTNLVKERSEYGSEEKMVTAILLNWNRYPFRKAFRSLFSATLLNLTINVIQNGLNWYNRPSL